MSTTTVDTFLTWASPVFTTERSPAKFSSISLFLDDKKIKRAVQTMLNVPRTNTEHNHDLVWE